MLSGAKLYENDEQLKVSANKCPASDNWTDFSVYRVKADTEVYNAKSFKNAIYNANKQEIYIRTIRGRPEKQIATSWLGSRGWTVTSELWNESLELEITPARIARWLADGSSYRTQLEAQGNQPLSAIQLELLHRGFGQRLNQAIPQQLAHHLVMARA